MIDTPMPRRLAPGRPHTREDKRRETSLRVEKSAVGLVLEHGFTNVTVAMICRQSGISQRTFFNYFTTKKDAIIGAEPPTIDEGRARAFIAATSDDLLPDVLTLMSEIGPRNGIDEQLFTDRLRVFGLNPKLMQEQMERMTRVTGEIAELVYLRLGRSAVARTESDADRAFRHGQAELLTHAMLGVVRYMALQWIQGTESEPGMCADQSRRCVITPPLSESVHRTIDLLRRSLRVPGL